MTYAVTCNRLLFSIHDRHSFKLCVIKSVCEATRLVVTPRSHSVTWELLHNTTLMQLGSLNLLVATAIVQSVLSSPGGIRGGTQHYHDL